LLQNAYDLINQSTSDTKMIATHANRYWKNAPHFAKVWYNNTKAD